jgi:hypothetical protein
VVVESVGEAISANRSRPRCERLAIAHAVVVRSAASVPRRDDPGPPVREPDPAPPPERDPPQPVPPVERDPDSGEPPVDDPDPRPDDVDPGRAPHRDPADPM